MSFTPAAHPLRTFTLTLINARRALQRARGRLQDQRASQITDNLGLIVIGIVAIVAIGGLISGLDTTIFTWVSKQLGLS